MAVDLYGRQGIRATSVADVAAKADVARATVLNHFGSAGGLEAAAIETVVQSVRIPTVAIFDGAGDTAERLRRLVAELFALYDRGEPWFYALGPEMRSVGSVRRREQRFWTEMQELYDAALGRLRKNRLVRAASVGLTSPATLGALKATGLSTAEAARIVGELLARFAERSRRAAGERA